MGIGHAEIVGLDRNSIEDARHETLTLLPAAAFGQLNPDLQLSNGDRGDRDVVAIVDQLAQGIASALGVDQDCRIQNQSRQGSVAGPTPSRSSRSSAAHASSGRLARSASLSAFPVPPLAGPMVATARPCLTTTYDSPPRSTLSNTSENRREASVALSCFIESDYRIYSVQRLPQTTQRAKTGSTSS